MEQGYVTKRALSLSLKQLMTKMALDKIRVTTVTDLTKVSRNTFYYHFSDINELLAWTYDNEVVFDLESFQNLASWKEGLLKVLEYTEANRQFCLNTFHSLSRDRLEDFLYRITSTMLATIMENEKKIDGLSPDLQAEIADFYGRAIVAQVIYWLQTNLREPKQELVNRIERMTGGMVKRVVNYRLTAE